MRSFAHRPQPNKFVRLLSKDELHAITTIFNRARGHSHGLNFGRFRDILHEALVGLPEYLARRLFREWNGTRSEELSGAEFIAGVATAVKGSRDDHLEMVFRMIRDNGDGKAVSKADMSHFFNCFAPTSGCVAIEQSKARRSWTADELLRELFGWSQIGRITFKKFLEVVGSGSSFSVLYFIDWIPILATRLLNTHDFLPVLAMPRKLTSLKLFETHRGLSTEQRDNLRFELRRILFILATDHTRVKVGSIIDRFRDAVADDSLVKAVGDAWQSRVNPDQNQSMESHLVDGVHEELKLFVLGLCCVQASSVHQVYRLLFLLFDEYSCGQLDVDQLGAFLQLTAGLGPIDSEREASIVIRRCGRSQSSLSSPPTSPGGSPAINTNDPLVLTLSKFVEVAQQQPGLSFAEVDSALLLFHLTRYSNTAIIPGHSIMSLHHLVDCYFSEEMLQSTAFCLLGPSEWQHIVERTMKCQSDLSAPSSAQIIHEEARELPSGHVMLSLSVWFLISFWLEKGNVKTLSRQSQQSSVSFVWTPTVQLHQDDQRCLRAFWLRISLNFTDCDGFERRTNFPQAIAFEQCTLQSVVDAALFQKRWCGRGEGASSSVTTICQCQVLIAERNTAGEIKTLAQQDDPTILSQDQLATSLGAVLPTICPSWGLGNTGQHEKLSFELRFSVVEIVEQSEREAPVLKHTEASFDVQKFVKPFQKTARLLDNIPRGLNNLGNTCFMNAVVQCLAATPPLKPRAIREETQNDNFSSSGLQTSPIQPASKSLPLLLAELFAGMYSGKQEATNSISPTNLLKAFSAIFPHMADGNQQDAQEFLVCLLGHLGDALKRNPKHSSEPQILSPRSHATLTSLFRPNDVKSEDATAKETASLQFGIEDSNGRHDRLVATEWWVSHLVNDPSVINILFSGQFKSALTCDHCAYQSARFEPFSSLQLPLIECTSSNSTTRKGQRDMVVVVHSTESSGSLAEGHGSIRTVVQVDEHSTVADMLVQLPTSRSQSGTDQYVIGEFDEFTIQHLLVTHGMEDQLDDKTPASALPNPVHAFELFNIPGSGDDTAAPIADSTRLYLRFVHRQNILVPFYCSTPIRQALCGSPFVCYSTCGALTGQALHQMVFHRFLLGRRTQYKPCSSSTDAFNQQSGHHYAPNFVLRRVGDDGFACSRCHWSTGCRGCQIFPSTTAAELLDLENCETIAIDWDLQYHAQDQSAFWWLQSYPTRDHPSYIHYRQTKTQSLMQSLQSLCSTDHLDVCCSNCQYQSPSTPHTKQLSLWSLPPILVLQLKRFELITSNGDYQWKKLAHSVAFPIHGLDLVDLLAPVDGAHSDSEPCSDRCSTDAMDPRVRRGMDFLQNELDIPLTSASRSCTKYDLYAVVHHSGSGLSSGHYTAHIRRPDETCWWLADDASVSPLSEDEVSPSSTAYLLFYVRQDVASGATELGDLFPPRRTAVKPSDSTSCTLQ